MEVHHHPSTFAGGEGILGIGIWPRQRFGDISRRGERNHVLHSPEAGATHSNDQVMVNVWHWCGFPASLRPEFAHNGDLQKLR